MQRRVDRPLGQRERTAAPLLQLLDDGVAVRRPCRDNRQDETVQMTFQHLRLHA